VGIPPAAPEPLALWAGAECTVNRVGNRFFDQLARTSHATRLTDLDLFAELGIRTLRYPVLWERTAPHGLRQADWSWPDERLERLRALGIRPIVGLVHHGSGPRHTSLVDPGFADGLAAFAQAVAERYPWVDAYTPVNEPLTTARFSGLYGHWYPHGRDDRTFARSLLNQCRAVALAMRAIRRINPGAQLIQTDDLGKTWSTPTLRYQACLENERRWLSFDLLCGRITPEHPMWPVLRAMDVAEDELGWFLDHPCPPDVIGINHYLSSERYLDEHLDRYPADSHGGNGRHAYADVLAARVRLDGAAGPYQLLRETWERYGLPIAVTEAHNGCTREEQLRWLLEVWQSAQRLRAEGGDIRAVTVWSLLGAYDWSSLVTRDDGNYEPGVFDLRSPQPRPTAIAQMIRDLAAGRTPDHPVLHTPGWWKRPQRLEYGFALDDTGRVHPASAAVAPQIRQRPSQPLLITGAGTPLAHTFAQLCESRGIVYRVLTREELDITQQESIGAVLAALRPWALINTVSYTYIDAAERDQRMCYRVNVDGASLLAACCTIHNVSLLTFSSDLVFDGAQQRPYLERDTVAPLSVYGSSLVEAEARVLRLLPEALVVRTSACFSPWDQHSFASTTLRMLAARQPVVAANDHMVSPTYAPDLAHTCLDLLIDGEHGVWHLSNQGAVTWADFAHEAARRAGLDRSGIIGQPTSAFSFAAPRPRYSVLGSERGMLLPTLDHALDRYVYERADAALGRCV
jgi:dTDP-4-dehydrorhamnose reductase